MSPKVLENCVLLITEPHRTTRSLGSPRKSYTLCQLCICTTASLRSHRRRCSCITAARRQSTGYRHFRRDAWKIEALASLLGRVIEFMMLLHPLCSYRAAACMVPCGPSQPVSTHDWYRHLYQFAKKGRRLQDTCQAMLVKPERYGW